MERQPTQQEINAANWKALQHLSHKDPAKRIPYQHLRRRAQEILEDPRWCSHVAQDYATAFAHPSNWHGGRNRY